MGDTQGRPAGWSDEHEAELRRLMGVLHRDGVLHEDHTGEIGRRNLRALLAAGFPDDEMPETEECSH